MLRSVKKLYGDKLGALDGEIGHVKDFYFDDQNWVVRYLVAHTGSWLSGRQVLLSPYALGDLDKSGVVVTVNLTRKQIEDSPSIATHKPVSRQYEEEYYRYYGWPYYWEGSGLWGMSGVPLLHLPPQPPLGEASGGGEAAAGSPDRHLRSTQAVNGYHLQATDGTAGHVCDFMINTRTWVIEQLVIKVGHRFSGKEVQIATSQVQRISYEESKVFVRLTSAAVEHSPVHGPGPVAAAA
jgi:hypothetical protein